MYHNSYTNPVTVWHQSCKFPILQIKWCLLFFNDEATAAESAVSLTGDRKYMTRLCEFFAIDKSEDFVIWNIGKSMSKPAHVIHFREKHDSLLKHDLYRIS